MSTMRFWLGWAVGIGMILMLGAWGLSYWHLNNYIKIGSDRMMLLAELRRGAVEEYFSTADAELRFWSTSPSIIELQKDMLALFEGAQEGAMASRVQELYVKENPNPPGLMLHLDNAGDGGAYSALHAQSHPPARLFVTQRGYYDFFLIGANGDVMYTVEKEADFGSNLETGEWKDSALAQVYAQAKQTQASRYIAVSDMRPYGPSNDAPAVFMATALHDEKQEFIGVLAFQLPTDRILDIMAYSNGMGESGETYLVGQDFLMRSDSRFTTESTVLKQLVETPTVARALQGEHGIEVVDDYRGIKVLSAYLPLEVGHTVWAVMAEIDVDEVATIAARERPSFSVALLFIYGLSFWSIWYWRGREMNSSQEGMEFGDMGFLDREGGAIGD